MRLHVVHEVHMEDDPFRPKLGRIRDRKGGKTLPYISRVLESAGKSTSGRSRRVARFTGARIGRGRAQGAIAAGRRRQAGQRRVIIKTRIVRMQDLGAAKAHLRYIQRDGVTPQGEPGQLYDVGSDRADGKAFLERSGEDRHQFRFIVSPEDELDDLKPFVRDLMRQMESDLGTHLDWVAVDHSNTGHPHTHVILRGKDDRGADLVIARDYIAHGMRETASDLLTRELGPQTELDMIRKLERAVDQERFTRLDRAILRDAEDGRLALGQHRAHDALRMGRLRTLERLGLAREEEAGVWRIAPDLEPVLRRMGERGDIIRTMQRELGETSRGDYAIYDPADPGARRLVGRVAVRGLHDEITDRQYLILDGVDGCHHYVDIGLAEEAPGAGAVVAVQPRPVTLRAADRTVAEVAAAHGGRYGADIHLQHDPNASVAFVEAHVRRLEAMRRAGAGVDRTPDGSWLIGSDHLDRATAFERGRSRIMPVTIETLSHWPLDRQVGADGATWLDRELVATTPSAIRDAGFGREVGAAIDRRRQWLLAQDLARRDGEQIRYPSNLIAVLRQRELRRVGAQLSRELGLDLAETRPGSRIEGVYRRRLDLASGRYALIERGDAFSLVAWRPVLERNLGRAVSGIERGDTISWTLGRQRGAPSIS
jgi:type IV secretory pathway VirD2 relaxase